MKRTRKIKKIIIAIMTSVWTVFSVFSSVLPVKADTPPTTTTYGYWSAEVVYPSQDGFSFGYGPFGVSVPITTGSGFTLTYRFRECYTGVITVGVTASTNWYLSNDYVSLEGGWFQSFPNTTNTNVTKSFSIYVDHSEGFTLCIIDANTNTFANNTVGLTFAYSGMTREENIGSDVDDIRSQIDLYLPGMSTSLSNIASNTSTMASDLATIKGYLDGLEGYTDQIEPYINQLVNYQRIQTFEVWQQLALWWGASMGDLQYDGNFPYFFYDSSLNTGAANNIKRIKIGNKRTTTLVFYSTVNQISQYYNIYGSHADAVDVTWSISTAVPGYPLYLYRVNFKNNYNGSIFISIEFTRDMTIYPLFLGDSLNIPEEVSILMGTEYENTYTRLLQSIANGIGNISIEQINENTTNINNYNDYQTSINNVENNYYTEYNNQSTVIENNNTFDFSGLDTTGVTAFNDLFTNIYNIPLVKYPILITLLGLVIVIILG